MNRLLPGRCYAPVSLGASHLHYTPVVHNICNYSLLPLGRELRHNFMLRPCFSKAIVKKNIYIFFYNSFSRVMIPSKHFCIFLKCGKKSKGDDVKASLNLECVEKF